jgi:short-subunit dehydrogenase
MKTQGKTIVVTGAGNGMGRALTILLLKKGARVAAVDINETYLNETAALAGADRDRLSTHVVDITDRAAVEALPAAVIAAHGAVDGVINNAGIIQHFVKISDMDLDDIQRVFDINFWGMTYVTKAFLPHLLARPTAHIVNISSMGGFLPVPGQTAYGASKAAVKLFSEGLHSELRNTNVHVTVVFPGAIATNIKANSGLAPDGKTSNKLTTPAKAAEKILDGMEKDKYQVLVGSDAKAMDFLCRLMPEQAAMMISSQMTSHLPN